MKIRDLQQFVLQESEFKPIEILGDKLDPFQKTLFGIKWNVKANANQLVNFAGAIYEQFFYEMLQNADDAKADFCGIFIKDKYLLIVNNGEPFSSDLANSHDKYPNGQLFSFLTKGKSDKSYDSTKKGEKGQGSKLLYGLLPDLEDGSKSQSKALEKALILQLRGIIIFSWKSWHNIETLLSTHPEDIVPSGPFDSHDYPLLTKTVFTYYPAMPLEKKKTAFSDKEEVLFSKEELVAFIQSVNDIANSFPGFKNKLTRGTMLFVPLGKGQAGELNLNVSERLKMEISISMRFCRHLKKISLNGEAITLHKHSINQLDLSPDLPLFDKTYFLFPAEAKNDEFSYTNFYKDFPVTKERYNLKFIINSKAYSIDDARQNVDFSQPYNREALREISELLKKRLIEISNNDRQTYLSIFKTFLVSEDIHSKGRNSENILKFLIEPIQSLLKSLIPIEGEGYANSTNNVVISSTPLDINLKDLKLDKDWISKDLINYEAELKEWGINEFGLQDIIESVDLESDFRGWVKTLFDSQYQVFLEEIREVDADLIRRTPFLKASNEEIYSFTEVEEIDDTFLFSPDIKNLSSCLKRHKAIVVGENLIANPDLWRTICSWEKKSELFNKLISFFNSVKEQLKPSEKASILHELVENFHDQLENKTDQVCFFQNIRGEFMPLDLLTDQLDELAPSSIFNRYRIEDGSNTKVARDFFLSPGAYWEKICCDWTEYLLPLAKKEVNKHSKHGISLFKQLLKIADQANHKNIGAEKLPMILGSDNQFHARSELYFSSPMVDFDEKKYLESTLLIPKICSLQAPHPDLRGVLKNSLFNQTTQDGPEQLADSLYTSPILTINEVKLLSSITPSGLLNKFYFKQTAENVFSINERDTNKHISYFSRSKRLIDFLESDKEFQYFTLLPESLFPILESDLRYSDEKGQESFLLDLIKKYGANEAFIELVESVGEQPAKDYINQYQVLELFDSEVFNENSFAYKFLKVCLKWNKVETGKSKITINGNPLPYYDKAEHFSLPVEEEGEDIINLSFQLSELLPEFKSKSAILQAVKTSFPIDVREIFEVKEPDLNWLNKELEKHPITPYRFFFKMAVKLSGVNITLPTISKFFYPQLLSLIASNKLKFYNKAYDFSDFIPSKCIWCNDSSLLLKKEEVPTWIESWIASYSGGLEFLITCGLKTDRIEIIKLRKKLLEGDDIVSEKEWKLRLKDPFFENTLEWCANNFMNISEEHQLILLSSLENLSFIDTQSNDDTPRYVLWLDNKSSVDSICYSFNRFDNHESPYYYPDFTGLDRTFELPMLLGQIEKRDLSVMRKPDKRVIEKLPVFSVKLDKDIEDPNFMAQEWTNPDYLEFKSDLTNDADIFEIMLVDGLIPFSYFFCFGETKEKVDTIDGNFGLIKRKKKRNSIYLQADANVVKELQAHQTEFFKGEKEYKWLSGLLFKFANTTQLTDIQKSIIENIEKSQFTQEEIFKRISVLVNGENSKGGDYGDGGYDLGREITDIELNNLQTKLKELLQFGELSKDDLNLLLDNLNEILNQLKEEKDDTEVNPHTGYFGERLMYHFFLLKGRQVKHVGDFEEAFDLELTSVNGKQEIEVKTNGKSILTDYPTFYVRKNQYEHIIRNKSKNYLILRLGLEDINMREVLKNFRDNHPVIAKGNELPEDVKKKLDSLAKECVERDSKIIANSVRLFRISYDDLKIIDSLNA